MPESSFNHGAREGTGASARACGQPLSGFNPEKAPKRSSPSPSVGPALPWGPVTASLAPCHNPLSSHCRVAPRCESWALAEAVASSFLSAETDVSGA